MEMPSIKLNEPESDIPLRVETIFEKINMEYSRLADIRKKQIINHSENYVICDALEGLLALIGEKDDKYNRLLMKQFHERLIDVHSPVYPEVEPIPQFTCGSKAWEEWDFETLSDYYLILCHEKGWEDFYNVYYMDSIKNYMVADMLNDLLIHRRIFGYDSRSFMHTDGELLFNHPEEEWLKDFDMDVKIPVKIIQ